MVENTKDLEQDRMEDEKFRLGEMLIEAGMLTPKMLKEALAIQKERQLRLGTILLQEGFVTEPQLVQALSRQTSIPWVNLWQIDVPDDLLKLVPVNVAEEFFLFPIYVRKNESGERELYVAMNDPFDDSALRFVAANAGIPVKPMIASPSDIAAAIRAYYYDEEVEQGETPLGSLAPPPPKQAPPVPPGQQTGPSKPPPPPAPPAKPTKSQLAPPVPTSSPSEELAAAQDPEKPTEDKEEAKTPDDEKSAQAKPAEKDDKSPSEKKPTPPEPPKTVDKGPPPPPEKLVDHPSQREVEKHMFGVGKIKKRGRSFSLTLLDGTTIAFGQSKRKRKSDVLTRDDLIAGLRAAATGAPVDELLPSDKWQPYVAALLEVLFRKHLVLFDELVTELNKNKK
jgi:type IV pilus assembly protein PilB